MESRSSTSCSPISSSAVLRGAGLSVSAGTVNHPELLRRVLEFAPDAIGTDRPHELRAGALEPAAELRGGVIRLSRMADLPSFRYRLEEQAPRTGSGGVTRGASVREFPASTGIAGVSMRLAPGSLRELHWHANAAEWAFVVSGCVPHHDRAPRRFLGGGQLRPR